MKPASPELFDLVKSLSKTEKGYFRRHSSIKMKGSDTNYSALFDAVSRQKEYDEKKILRLFKNQPFTRQFPVAKDYLFNRILKALHSYHHNIFEEIRSLLHFAEILHEKGLYHKAIKTLARAKKLAEIHNLYVYMPAILRTEHILAIEKYDLKWIERIARETEHYLLLLQNINNYRLLSQTIAYYVLQKDKLRKSERLKKIDAVIKNPLLENESTALSFSARMYFNEIYFFYWYFRGDYSKALHFVRNVFTLFNSHPEKIQHQIKTYIVCANNLLYLYFETRNYDQFKKNHDKIKNIASSVKTLPDKTYFFFVYWYHLLKYLHYTGRLEKASRILTEFFREYLVYEPELSGVEKTTLHMHVALIYFGEKKYNNCLQYLNKIRNESPNHTHPNIERSFRIFYLIVHYEMQHRELLSHLIESIDYFLHKGNQPSRFENILIEFFKNKIIKPAKQENSIENFKQLKKDLLPLTKDLQEKKSFEFFDYISWVESKIENRSLAETLKRKANRTS